jgi:hypothetical protein
VIHEENNQHNRDDSTQQHYKTESMLMVHQPLHNKIPVRRHQLSSHIVSELCANQPLLFDDASKDLNSNNKAVNSDYSVQENKC